MLVFDRCVLTGSVYSSSGGASTPTPPSGDLTVDQAWNEMHNTPAPSQSNAQAETTHPTKNTSPAQRLRQALALTPTSSSNGGGVVAKMYQRILSNVTSSSPGTPRTSHLSPLASSFSPLYPAKPSFSFTSSNASTMSEVAAHPGASPGPGAKSWLARINGGFSFPSRWPPCALSINISPHPAISQLPI